jgi:hypothetical protein
MSKQNKGYRAAPKQTMNNSDQTTKATEENKVVETEAGTQTTLQAEQTTATETSVVETSTKQTPVAEKEAEQTPTSEVKEIVVGSVVKGTTSNLGQAATPAQTKAIIAQKPVAQPQDVSKFDKKINEVKASGSPVEKSIVSTLETYVVTMAPGKLNEDSTIHRLQIQLWGIIKNTLETEENFDNNWKLLVSYFRQYRDGALGGSSPFRGLDNIKGISSEQNQAFMNVLNLLIVTAGLTNKKDVSKHTRLDKSITSIFKESVRQRVINYYV